MLSDKGEEWEEGQVVTGVQYKASDGSDKTALGNLTIVCDGMYSSFRKKLSKPDMKHPSYFVGLLLKDVAVPHPNFGHVILAEPSPVLFYPISSSEVRCLVDYPGEKLPPMTSGALHEYLLERVAPQVPPMLKEAFCKAVKQGRIRTSIRFPLLQRFTLPSLSLYFSLLTM